MDLVRKILREIALFGACALSVAIVGLIAVDQLVMPRYVRQGVEVPVPDLIGLTPLAGACAIAGRGPAHERTRTAMGCFCA